MQKQILLPQLKTTTFWSRDWSSNHWAIPANLCWSVGCAVQLLFGPELSLTGLCGQFSDGSATATFSIACCTSVIKTITDIYQSPDLVRNTPALGTYKSKSIINGINNSTHIHTPTHIHPPPTHTHKHIIHVYIQHTSSCPRTCICILCCSRHFDLDLYLR